MGIFDALFGWLTKPKNASNPNVKASVVAEREQGNFAPVDADSEGGPALSILVASFGGHEGAFVTDKVTDCLSSLNDVKVLRLNQSLQPPNGMFTMEGLTAASEQGRDILFSHNADVLIWGNVDDQNSTASLRFVSINPPPEGRPGAFMVNDQLDIPSSFPLEFEDVVAACALATAGYSIDKSKKDIRSSLHDYASRIKPLIEYGPGNLSSVQRISLYTAIANVIAVDVMTNGKGKNLESAAELYRKVISLIPSDFDGPRQAVLQTHLADTLQVLSAVDDKNAELTEQAVQCFQASLAGLDEKKHPQEWAQTQVRLGLALYRHAIRANQTKLMKEAVLAMKQSLKVYDRKVHPGKWAEVMNHSGVIMTAMGEEINNDAILQQAIRVFSETLEIRRRETAPVLWAQTTNNLGAAAFALAKRQKDKSLMDKAAMAFEGAADVYREAGQVKRVSVIEKNLNRVQRRLEIM